MENRRERVAETIRDFKLPRYEEIPNVGLYLEQTAKYISEYLSCLGDFSLTRSMISNYVKKDLVANPVKKQYDREQIACLIFIAVAKTVLSMEDIRLLVRQQQRTYPADVAYDYFCSELENVLFYVFGLKENLDTVGQDDTQEKDMLRSTIITVAYRVYLSKYFEVLHGEEPEAEHGKKSKKKD